MTLRCPRCNARIRMTQGSVDIPECEGTCDGCGLQVVGFIDVTAYQVRDDSGAWMHARPMIEEKLDKLYRT